MRVVVSPVLFPPSSVPMCPVPTQRFRRMFPSRRYSTETSGRRRSLLYNLTFEQGLGANWLLRAAYTGNKGDHLGGTGDQEAGLLEINPAVYIPGTCGGAPCSTEANTQQRRVNPNFGYIHTIDSGVNSNYSALAVTLQTRGHARAYIPVEFHVVALAQRLRAERPARRPEHKHLQLWPLLRLRPRRRGRE